MARARLGPSRLRASLWNTAVPAIRKPPLRPLAPPATVPASSSSTSTPRRARASAHDRPAPPPPTTQASTSTSPSRGGRASYGESSQYGVVEAVTPPLYGGPLHLPGALSGGRGWVVSLQRPAP